MDSLPQTFSWSAKGLSRPSYLFRAVQCRAGLSSGPSYLLVAFICLVAFIHLVGPGAHYDNTVQAQRPGKPIIRHQVLPVYCVRFLRRTVGEAWVAWPLRGLSCSD
ncbi:hypothetical protein Tco_0345531 [Tanacetum coccineum]